MKIDYSEKGKVKITMIDYIKGMLDELPIGMAGESATPTVNLICFRLMRIQISLMNQLRSYSTTTSQNCCFYVKRQDPTYKQR
jgi:hypothetical protein